MAVGDCLKMGAGGLLGGALLVLVAGGRPGGTAAAEFGCRDSGMQPLGFAPVAEELVEVDPVVCTFPSLPVVAPSLEPVIVCVEEPGQDSDFASTCEDFGPCFAPEAPFRPDARGRNARSGDAGQAVRKGVEWLAAHQYADGTWPSSVCRACGVSGVAASGLERDHLGTALALRAMLLSGCLPGDRRYREVTLGLLWLRRNQRPTGEFAGLTDAGERAVRHFAATLFLAEVYGMEGDTTRQKRIHDVLVRGVRITERSQSRAGGWLYTPNQDGDEGSVTVTQIQGLRAARNAGIKVSSKPASTFGAVPLRPCWRDWRKGFPIP